MDQSTFETLAEETLDGLFEAIDDCVGDDVEVDFDNSILTIELENGGQYIINKHAPTTELWVSSPQSGAAHYGYDEDKKAWLSTRSGEDLKQKLATELSRVTRKTVVL